MICQRLNDIQKAADLILAGELVAFPTETVYGLGALGLDEKAILKIFKAKNRPAYNPLILHVSDAQKALELFKLESEDLFWELAKAHWPGPLTLVAQKADHVPKLATGGLDKVAVRVPGHPIALELLKRVGAPVAAPSANASQRPSSTMVDHVLLTLGDKISAVLEGGSCQYGLESTVLDITQNPPVILRPGAILLGKFNISSSKDSEGSPGRLDKHYAPLISKIRWASLEEIKRAPKDCGFLLCTPNDPVGYAQALFAALYRLEQSGVSCLLIEELPDGAAWDAVRDRINRALS